MFVFHQEKRGPYGGVKVLKVLEGRDGQAPMHPAATIHAAKLTKEAKGDVTASAGEDAVARSFCAVALVLGEEGGTSEAQTRTLLDKLAPGVREATAGWRRDRSSAIGKNVGFGARSYEQLCALAQKTAAKKSRNFLEAGGTVTKTNQKIATFRQERKDLYAELKALIENESDSEAAAARVKFNKLAPLLSNPKLHEWEQSISDIKQRIACSHRCVEAQRRGRAERARPRGRGKHVGPRDDVTARIYGCR